MNIICDQFTERETTNELAQTVKAHLFSKRVSISALLQEAAAQNYLSYEFCPEWTTTH